MILLLDTKDPTCRLTLIDGNKKITKEWLAERQLANGLLKYLQANLEENDWTWTDIEAIGVFEGPGSFTGLRIGLTVTNTLADSLSIPIVGGKGEDWKAEVLAKLRANQNDKIVMPFYGSEAHITLPRK